MIRVATEADVQAMREILNYNIVHSSAIYMYEEQSFEERMIWYKGKVEREEPIFVYEEDGVVAGYATYGAFRPHPAFLYTVEHSVYVHHDHYGKKIGEQLMLHLIEEATKRGVKTMVGGISADNVASIRIHEKLGFTYSGTIRNAGYKFNRWLDLAFYQLDLPGPFEGN